MKAIQDFIRTSGLSLSSEAYAQAIAAFCEEMEHGLKGESSSMKMLPAYIGVSRRPYDEQPLIVMDAGGTNLRVALVKLAAGKQTEILYQKVEPLPGRRGTISREAFFDAFANALAPVAAKSDRIGLCFSFPCKILPDFDGEVIKLAKEVSVEGIEGARLSRCILDALKARGLPCNHRIVVLNDTTATLLSMLPVCPPTAFEGYISMILGTGANTCYTESNRRILKDPFLSAKDGSSIVNMESGGFDRLLRTQADIEVDNATQNTGEQTLEKMISGAYQGSVFAALLRQAAREGCFSQRTGERLLQLASLDTKELCDYCNSPSGDGLLSSLTADCEQDALSLFRLADAMMDRVAACVAMTFQGILTYADLGHDPLRPVCIAIEGSTYVKNPYLQHKIIGRLNQWAAPSIGRHIRLIVPTNANLIGSAIAVHAAE